jgi:hypothetical protein
MYECRCGSRLIAAHQSMETLLRIIETDTELCPRGDLVIWEGRSVCAMRLDRQWIAVGVEWDRTERLIYCLAMLRLLRQDKLRSIESN